MTAMNKLHVCSADVNWSVNYEWKLVPNQTMFIKGMLNFALSCYLLLNWPTIFTHFIVALFQLFISLVLSFLIIIKSTHINPQNFVWLCIKIYLIWKIILLCWTSYNKSLVSPWSMDIHFVNINIANMFSRCLNKIAPLASLFFWWSQRFPFLLFRNHQHNLAKPWYLQNKDCNNPCKLLSN